MEVTIAEVAAHATSRHAHHEAGHAVAAVASGGVLLDVRLGTTDYSVNDDSNDEPGFTRHRTHRADLAYVTFAGPFAEAMWMVENEPDADDFYEALEYALWDNNRDGDAAKLETQLGLVGDQPEWCAQLNDLWPVIQRVAGLLIDGKTVTHDAVQALLRDAELEN